MRFFAVNMPFQEVRISMYRKAGVHIGNLALLGGHVWIDMYAPVTLEDNVLLAGYNFILTHSWIGTGGKPLFGAVTIKRGAQIGLRAIIMPGVTVGRGAVVGAGSVVTRDVPDGVTVAGSPAKPTKKTVEQEMFEKYLIPLGENEN